MIRREERAHTSSQWVGEVEVGTITHGGRDYAAQGACVTEEYLACYPHADGTVRAWGGEVLGTYRVLSSRPAIFFGRRSVWGERYYYMRAAVGGREYSIRGFGPGMSARGRVVAR